MFLKLVLSAALVAGALTAATLLVPSRSQADDSFAGPTTVSDGRTIVLAQNAEKKKKKATSSETQGRSRGETPPPNDRGS